MKSSYYTGYEDLDAELRSLYSEQLKLEVQARNGLSIDERAQYGNIIKQQDVLLKLGEIRDNEKISFDTKQSEKVAG